MAARADRGIFLATSAFSADAKREAAREGATPIEMLDLTALISLLTDLRLGVTARTIFAPSIGLFFENTVREGVIALETSLPTRDAKGWRAKSHPTAGGAAAQLERVKRTAQFRRAAFLWGCHSRSYKSRDQAATARALTRREKISRMSAP